MRDSRLAFNKAWKFGNKLLKEYLLRIRETEELSGETREVIQRVVNRIHKRKPSSTVPKIDLSPYPRDFRIICNRDSDNERAIPIFKALGARIRHRPPRTNSGTHRFYVNNQGIALFIRRPGESFVGVTGSDTLLQECLKADFLDEWDLYPPDIVE